jgi:hypothetical protein
MLKVSSLLQSAGGYARPMVFTAFVQFFTTFLGLCINVDYVLPYPSSHDMSVTALK